MKYSIIYCLLLLIGFGLSVHAQTYNEENASEIESINKESISNNLLSSQTPNEVVPQDNSIFINQIGNYNEITASLQTQKSSLQLTQQGNYNTTGLYVRASEVNQTVVQSGDDHRYVNFSDTEIQNLEVLQTGTGQNLIMHGDNSISDNLKIRMNGNGQSVTIRNFF